MGQVTQETRKQMIAEAAYFRAEHRGFHDGDPVADWLEAEHEIDTRLGNGHSRIDGLEERLAATNERLKAFRKRLTEMTSGARREWEDDVEKLARYRDRLRKRVKEAQAQTGQAAEKAKLKAEEVWVELSTHVEKLSRRKTNRS